MIKTHFFPHIKSIQTSTDDINHCLTYNLVGRRRYGIVSLFVIKQMSGRLCGRKYEISNRNIPHLTLNGMQYNTHTHTYSLIDRDTHLSPYVITRHSTIQIHKLLGNRVGFSCIQLTDSEDFTSRHSAGVSDSGDRTVPNKTEAQWSPQCRTFSSATADKAHQQAKQRTRQLPETSRTFGNAIDHN